MAKAKQKRVKAPLQRYAQVTFGRTINMGNYESVRVDLTANVLLGEDFLEVLERVREELWAIEQDVKQAKSGSRRPY